MNSFQAAIARLRQSQNGHGKQEQENRHQDEPATVKAAQALSLRLRGIPISDDRKAQAGQVVHYATGIIDGAVYGVLQERLPAASAGFGTLYGATLWAAADEIAVPALGLSKPASEYPATIHLQALASHLVYGVATWAAVRAIRSVW
jgi:hypothetical protein